jgi:hypothetical protein
MKRLAIATALLTALSAGASAGSLPKAIKMVDKMKVYSTSHYVRGQGAEGHWWHFGRSSSTAPEAEARQAAPANVPPSRQAKPQPQPARAD